MTQLPLLGGPPIQPLQAGAGHYLIVLKNMKGERRALAHADEAIRRRTTPLFESPGRNRLKGLVLNRPTISGWVANVAQVIGTAQAVLLDFPPVTARHVVSTARGARPALLYAFDMCRRRGLTAVPVVSLPDRAGVMPLVQQIVQEDGRGVCFRLRLNVVLAHGSTFRGLVLEALRLVEVQPEDVDLVLDLDLLRAETESSASDLSPIITELAGLGGWRSVVLLGSSMPGSLTCIPEGTVGTIERKEWQLWCELRSLGLQRQPSFGDYGIQGPKDPNVSKGGQARANVRYTTEDAIFIARGRGAEYVEGKEQYIELCQKIVDRRTMFRGSEYSWGDRQIEETSDGQVPPGGQDDWRAAGTSHHLAVVVEQLASLDGGIASS